jgi:hypothetical protein
MTVKELLGRIDSDELSEWLARERSIHRPVDFQVARICHTVASSFAKGAKFADFLPRKEEVPMDDAAIRSVMLGIMPRPAG